MLEAGFDEECRIGIQPHDLVAMLDFDPCSTGMREHLKMKWTLRLSSIESDIPLPYLEKCGTAEELSRPSAAVTLARYEKEIRSEKLRMRSDFISMWCVDAAGFRYRH